nr:hypothetical protein [Tanacetum cinerariifolium]
MRKIRFFQEYKRLSRRVDIKDHLFTPNSKIELLLFDSNHCIDSVKRRSSQDNGNFTVFFHFENKEIDRKGLRVLRDNFAYKEYGMRLMLAPRSAKALHKKALLKLHGIRKLPGSSIIAVGITVEVIIVKTSMTEGTNFFEESVKKSWGKNRLMKAVRSSSYVSIVPSLNSSNHVFASPVSDMGNIIRRTTSFSSQVVTFNGKFICGFMNGDYRTGSQSDNTVDNLHGFIIHGSEIFKGNEKVMKVIDVWNWRIDNSRVL